jgi:hypothetical protein
VDSCVETYSCTPAIVYNLQIKFLVQRKGPDSLKSTPSLVLSTAECRFGVIRPWPWPTGNPVHGGGG